MNVRTLCLAILNFQDATGYEIRKLSMDGKYSHFVDASFGSIYPALNKLENDGFVTFKDTVEAGKPNRKVYSITDAGRLHFLQSLETPPVKDVFRSEFLMIAVCAESLPPEVVQNAINTRREQLTSEIELLKSIAENPEASQGVRWAANYGMDCMSNSLTYLEENKPTLNKISGIYQPIKEEAAE